MTRVDFYLYLGIVLRMIEPKKKQFYYHLSFFSDSYVRNNACNSVLYYCMWIIVENSLHNTNIWQTIFPKNSPEKKRSDRYPEY